MTMGNFPYFPNDAEEFVSALKAAFLLGFLSSGEGYNGEYPFEDFNGLDVEGAWRSLEENGYVDEMFSKRFNEALEVVKK